VMTTLIDRLPTMTEPTAKEFRDKADVSARRIAKVYATALLNAADKNGDEQAVMWELESLVRDVFEKEPRLEVLLSGAAIGRHARQAILREVFAGRASTTFKNFVQVLNDHERLNLLRPILGAATELYDQRHHRLRVFVASAVPLPDDIRQRLETGVRTRFHLEPVLVREVDPALLGGLKIRIGDLQFDASVRNRLDLLRDQVLARSSHEIQSRRDRFSSAN
jgi:F-type H+-transporting ATPase subunit delta